MASNLKRSKRTVGKRLDDLHRRVLHMQKRPAPRRIGSRVIVTTNLTQDAVTNVELAPDSVTPEALAPDSVTNDAIAPGAITNTELADDAGGADTTFSSTAPLDPAIGDIWFDSTDSLKLKRWDGTAWVSMRDLGIAAAQAGADAASTAATAAQTTADGKNKVYRQTAEPTGGTYAEGDLWFDTDDNNKIYRRTGTAWVGVQLGGEALANINANKITAGSIDASVITVSNLDAGNLTAGTIAASRITSTSISAANITAAQITSGAISSARITSDSISAADINADRITAGTITGRAINNGSGTFQVDTAGNMTCTSANVTGVLSANDGSRIGNFYFNTYGLTNGPGPGLLGPMQLDTYNNIIYTPWMRVSDGSNTVDVRQGWTYTERYGAGGTAPVYIARERAGTNKNFCAFALAPYEGGAIGTISHNGTGAVSYNTTSDSRLKIDLNKPFDALALTNSLTPRVYKMRLAAEDEKDDEHLGFFAQELYEVYPEAVNVGIDAAEEDIDVVKMDPWGIDYSRLTPLLTKAIQELSAKIEVLEQKIEQLESNQ